MPDIGTALDAALSRSPGPQGDIGEMVRASIEETLHTQLKHLRLGLEAPQGRSAAARL